ncbi:MAG TPA: urease accessory UreF family protein [Verrucomicrobiae bacterium]
MRTSEKSLRAAAGPQLVQGKAEDFLKGFRALWQQVGAPEAPAAFWAGGFDAPAGLGRFLEDYLTELLMPRELPAIVTAWGHARRGELRELLAHDSQLAEPLRSTPFAAPSRRMGRLQLARLRPLREDRLVQRYLAAVESGQAHGWHTVVYGVTLAVYSLPLRQGLAHYSQEALSALAAAAGRSKNFPQSEIDGLVADLLPRVPPAIETALAESVH